MKWVLRLLLLAVSAGLAYGFYLKETAYAQGEKIIGISVLVLCLVLMPLFIFHRYRYKDLSKLTFRGAELDKNQKDKKS